MRKERETTEVLLTVWFKNGVCGKSGDILGPLVQHKNRLRRCVYSMVMRTQDIVTRDDNDSQYSKILDRKARESGDGMMKVGEVIGEILNFLG